ncbi:hypothetical protein AQI95_15485 [Streptomyces yokosukanensis]|uniref:HTTM-like domain-containing protein n=1 Tax=Streptomyces yokosukanensis TaxID=67386 RepID=A0A101P7G3_9ACTN|nr:hypothetical protein [Streptomyces yokosukanensis]KUN06287.1 hypothetical protein AQI95_15485 [Streptomyces yokosukanensis]
MIRHAPRAARAHKMAGAFLLARLDGFALRLARRERRLIGLSLMRLVIGFATILYCLADYSNRQFLWGPHAYDSPSTASAQIPGGGFSLYLFSDSQAWFEFLFHATILTSAAFMIYGGRALTVVQAVMMWSLHYRNQDLLEGGDNLAQILVIFLAFTCSNAYFAPGAKKRREKLLAQDRQPAISTVLHNLATYLIVFQTAVLYLAAGYWKIFGKVWQDGVAMYYISRETEFHMSATFAHVMSNAYLGTAMSYATIVIELAFPFALVSSRAWLRKANILALEAMHLGIAAFMGLVCFGLLMIGADSVCLRDEDYRSLWRRLQAGRLRVAANWPGEAGRIRTSPIRSSASRLPSTSLRKGAHDHV